LSQRSVTQPDCLCIVTFDKNNRLAKLSTEARQSEGGYLL